MAQIVFAVRHILSIRYIAAAPFISSITWWQNLLFFQECLEKKSQLSKTYPYSNITSLNKIYCLPFIFSHYSMATFPILYKAAWKSIDEKYVGNIIWILLFIVGHLLPPLLDGKIYCFPRNIRTAAYTTPIASLSHWRPHKHNPRIKHIRAQVNWQNTTNSNIQICRAKITRSSKCRDQNIGDNLFYCWPPAKLNRPYLRRNSRDKQTFLRLKVPPQENAPSCIKILHQQRDPEPKYPMLLFVHIKEIQYRKLHLPSLSRQYIHYDYKQKNDKVLILLR